jgi:carboxymethylenebutenolidase
MHESVVDIPTRDGAMNTYIFRPDGDGPFPVVIHYMDSVGVREELSDMCRRLATVGYYVIMPNLYYRLVRCVDLDANRLRDPAYEDSIALLWKLNRSLSNTMIEQDTQSLFDFIGKEPAARGGKVGIVGYCMSGRFVFRLAGAFPDRVGASASVYGAGLISDQQDSAHLLAPKIKGEMYFACAEHDHYITEEVIARLRSIIDETGIKGSIEIYPEAEHGFAFPSRRLYHKVSSERHWERLFAMFRRTL